MASNSLFPLRRLRLVAVIGLLLSVLATGPAVAQYGGTPTLFVDPVQVEIDGTFDAVGFGCPAGSVVSITIDGFPGVLGTATVNADGSYSVEGIPMPAGVIAGQDYVVRASCGAGSATFTITAVCNGGDLPVNGNCADGNNQGSGPSPTTTQPGGATSTTGGGGTTTIAGSGPGGGTGGDGQGLAFTGASFAEQAAQIGVTLVAIGAVLILLTTRRRDPADG